MKRWTKKAIRELRSQLNSFVLAHEMYYPAERIRTVIEEKRLEIVTGGLEGWIKLLKERAESDRATSAHYAKMAPGWLEETRAKFGEKQAEKSAASNAETVERFAKMAADNDKAVAYVERVIAKLKAEGLPPEVASYIPKRGPRGWEEST
jgi:hypothetical protein